MNMDFDISLDLGLGHLHEQKHIQIHKKKAAYPSLTLGVVEPSIIDRETNNNYHVATKTESCEYINLHPHVSSPNVVSSFSNSSISIAIKRERDDQFNSEEHAYEAEKVPFVDIDFDENGNPNNKKKLRLTKEQSAILEDTFKDHSTLNPKQKQELARNLNLRTRQVEVWFQNRRARTKLKQTEVECEELKKCYETLTEENKRLETELKELKSTEEPFNYNIQLPVASHNICPSCKGICTGNGGESNKNGPSAPTTTLLLGTKSQLNFYTNTNNYMVTQSSATIAS